MQHHPELCSHEGLEALSPIGKEYQERYKLEGQQAAASATALRIAAEEELQELRERNAKLKENLQAVVVEIKALEATSAQELKAFLTQCHELKAETSQIKKVEDH
ncbi:hypothetical protein HaLaN_02147 [Haematococcus lacustris]|uniref:Uncharacterized protein n=1 Tax=Haematococcus lacustris TaxID=44745 RepID=A0A699YMR1_HAELA|nr:hypothetical protein HaLaN_02147 [Haematococcus lacustris]